MGYIQAGPGRLRQPMQKVIDKFKELCKVHDTVAKMGRVEVRLGSVPPSDPPRIAEVRNYARNAF